MLTLTIIGLEIIVFVITFMNYILLIINFKSIINFFLNSFV